MNSPLRLGQRVRFSQTLNRRTIPTPEGVRESFGTETYKAWRADDEFGEGVLVGLRTLSNGIRLWAGPEEGYVYESKESVKAALVATVLRKKHIYVPVENIEVIEPELDVGLREALVNIVKTEDAAHKVGMAMGDVMTNQEDDIVAKWAASRDIAERAWSDLRRLVSMRGW